MIKTLYLSYDGLTDPLGQSQILPYIGKLSNTREIHIISCEKKENFLQYETDINEFIDELNVYWHPLSYNKFPPILSTVYDLWKIYLTSIKFHKIFGFTTVHCRSHLTAIIGHYLKKKINIPYIFDMRSFFPEERIDGGLWPQNNFIYKLIFSYFKKMEKKMLITADHVVVLTEKARQILNLEDNKISVIPCCADFDYFDYNKISQESVLFAKKTLGIKDDSFVLSYLGSLGTWYMLEEMLDFFKVLKSNKPNSVFLFLSPTDPKFIIDKVKQKGINEDDIYIKFSTRKELPTLLSVSSVSIFFIKNTFSKKASSPTKHAELMGLGIPVIANSGVGDIDQIILNTNTGKIINLDNHNAFEDSCKNINELTDIGKDQIRKQGKEIFSLEIGVAKYSEIYLRLENFN